MVDTLRQFSQRLGRWCLYFALSVPVLPATAQLLDETAFFDWAEITYPSLFTSHETTQQTGNYNYRYYPTSRNALGVSDGTVYALGALTGQTLLAVDTLAAFQCMVYPDRCKDNLIEVGSTTLRYGRTAIFTIAGSAVEQVGSTVSLGTQCSNPQFAKTLGTQVRNVSCTLTGTGSLAVTVKDASGTLLASRSFTIPEPRVQIQTNQGNVLVQLNPTAAPITVANFMQYVNAGFYTNTLFHRVIPGFMAQGGGYTSSTTSTTTTTATNGLSYKTPIAAGIKLESNNGLSNLRGTIAMARTSIADSATSQFFINLVDNAFLNYASSTNLGYAVFGTVVDGMAVIDKIATIPTKTVGGTPDIPSTNVIILNATQVQ